MRRLAIFIQLFTFSLLATGLLAEGPPPAGAGAPGGETKSAKDKKKTPKDPKKSNEAQKGQAQGEGAAKAAVGEFQQRPEQVPTPVAPSTPRAAALMVEPGQAYLEIRYNVDNTDIQGNRDRSFLNPGINHTSEVTAFLNQPVREIRRFETLVVHRYTDNPRVDPERNSLQRFYARFTGPSFETNFGDALVNYSRFSFNQNIKGLNAWKNVTPQLRLTGTVGLFADRWGSIYRDFTTFRNITLDCQAGSLALPAAQRPLSGCVESPPGSGAFVLSPANPTKPYTRRIAGARLEQKVGRTGWAAVNWSHGADLQQSLPDALTTCIDRATGERIVRAVTPGCQTGEQELAGARRSASESFDNHVVTFDSSAELQPLRLRVGGEFAISWTAGGLPTGATQTNSVCASLPQVVGGAVLDSRCFSERAADFASRFDANQRIGKLNWRVDYSRFQPNFFSGNARQIRDLQDFNARGEFEVIKQLTVAGSWRRSNDNLNARRNFTSIVRAPEVRLVFRQLPFYRRMSIDLGYRERNLDTDYDFTKTTCVDNGAKVPRIVSVTTAAGITDTQREASSCFDNAATTNFTEEVNVPNLFRQRSTRIPFVGVSLPIRDTLIGFDYEKRLDRDADRPALSTDTDRFAISLRGNYTWGGWDFSPSFRMELERLKKFLPIDPTKSVNDLSPGRIFSSTGLINGGSFNRAAAREDFDTNRSFQAGFLLEAPRYVRLEGQYREFNSLSLTPLNPGTGFAYLNQGFKRPTWRGSITYKIRNEESKTLTFYYDRSNNFFDPGDPVLVRDLKSFRETIIGGTLLIRFRQ